MSTHNIHFMTKQENFHKYPYIFAFLGYLENFVGTQKQVRISHGKRVNLVFELLGFYCIQIS